MADEAKALRDLWVSQDFSVNPYESPRHAVIETPLAAPPKPMLQQLVEAAVAIVFLIVFAYLSVPALRFAKKQQANSPASARTAKSRTSAR